MSVRTIVVVALVWVLSLVTVAAVVSAQAPSLTPLREPKVLSGADLGFRVEGMIGQVPAGTLVVRVDGQWVEATSVGIMVPRRLDH